MHDPSAMIRAFGLHATADHVSFLADENARLTALAAELAEALEDSAYYVVTQVRGTELANAMESLLARSDVRALLDREDQAQ